MDYYIILDDIIEPIAIDGVVGVRPPTPGKDPGGFLALRAKVWGIAVSGENIPQGVREEVMGRGSGSSGE